MCFFFFNGKIHVPTFCYFFQFQSSAPPCGGSIIFPAYSEKTQHIAELVAGQKEKQIKRSKSVPRHRYYDQSNHYSRNSYTSNPRPPRFSSSRDNRFYDNLRSHISLSSTSSRRPSDYNNESHTIVSFFSTNLFIKSIFALINLSASVCILQKAYLDN